MSSYPDDPASLSTAVHLQRRECLLDELHLLVELARARFHLGALRRLRRRARALMNTRVIDSISYNLESV